MNKRYCLALDLINDAGLIADTKHTIKRYGRK